MLQRVRLGPPSDYGERLQHYRESFPKRRYGHRNEGTEEGRLRNNNEMIYQLLITHTLYEWTLAETFVFREVGLILYYMFTYSKQHEMESDVWNHDLFLKLAKEVNLANAVIANMNYWAIERNKTSYFVDENWQVIFSNRRIRNPDEAWRKQMLHDLKWVLRRHKIGDVIKQRSKYWDEYPPDSQAFQEAKTRLMGDIKL